MSETIDKVNDKMCLNGLGLSKLGTIETAACIHVRYTNMPEAFLN